MRMNRIKFRFAAVLTTMLALLMAFLALPGLFAAPTATSLTVPEVAVCCADICQLTNNAPASVMADPEHFYIDNPVIAASIAPASYVLSPDARQSYTYSYSYDLDAPEVAPRCCCSRCVNFTTYATLIDSPYYTSADEYRVKGGHRMGAALMQGHCYRNINS